MKQGGNTFIVNWMHRHCKISRGGGASSAMGRVFDPRSSYNKDYEICIWCFPY